MRRLRKFFGALEIGLFDLMTSASNGQSQNDLKFGTGIGVGYAMKQWNARINVHTQSVGDFADALIHHELGVPDLAVRAKGTSLRLASDVVDGLRFVLRSAVLRSTMTLTLVVAVFFGMTTTLLVVMAYEALHGGASAYGFIEAAIGAGAGAAPA